MRHREGHSVLLIWKLPRWLGVDFTDMVARKWEQAFPSGAVTQSPFISVVKDQKRWTRRLQRRVFCDRCGIGAVRIFLVLHVLVLVERISTLSPIRSRVHVGGLYSTPLLPKNMPNLETAHAISNIQRALLLTLYAPENSVPPTLLATLIFAQHARPFQPLPMMFPPVLLFTSYLNLSGYESDAAGISAAWSGLYALLAMRRSQVRHLPIQWPSR